VFDPQGNKVATLVDNTLEAGKHSFPFRPDTAATGAYTYTLQTETNRTAGQISLMR